MYLEILSKRNLLDKNIGANIDPDQKKCINVGLLDKLLCIDIFLFLEAIPTKIELGTED